MFSSKLCFLPGFAVPCVSAFITFLLNKQCSLSTTNPALWTIAVSAFFFLLFGVYAALASLFISASKFIQITRMKTLLRLTLFHYSLLTAICITYNVVGFYVLHRRDAHPLLQVVFYILLLFTSTFVFMWVSYFNNKQINHSTVEGLWISDTPRSVPDASESQCRTPLLDLTIKHDAQLMEGIDDPPQWMPDIIPCTAPYLKNDHDQLHTLPHPEILSPPVKVLNTSRAFDFDHVTMPFSSEFKAIDYDYEVHSRKYTN
ncbi:hypothetical protein AB6A40_004992 [Gnathostoma spinigerum]|uniref:Uncharacterized protein n=1 Tax=Gnathostoma spinigerum TaxID=75299 RepID=A0ABD6EMU2_9BILA